MKNPMFRFVFWLSVALCLYMGLSGCVMPGDLDNLQQAQEDYQDSMDAKLAAYEAGDITEDEFEAAMKEAEAARKADIAAVKEDISDRTGSMLTTDPTSLLIGIGTSIAGSIWGTNAIRNRKRRRRGEPV